MVVVFVIAALLFGAGILGSFDDAGAVFLCLGACVLGAAIFYMSLHGAPENRTGGYILAGLFFVPGALGLLLKFIE